MFLLYLRALTNIHCFHPYHMFPSLNAVLFKIHTHRLISVTVNLSPSDVVFADELLHKVDEVLPLVAQKLEVERQQERQASQPEHARSG